MMGNRSTLRLWLARILVGLVTGWNLQAALIFIFKPDAYVAGFELSGLPGETALRGVGVLFLMWIVPYTVAFWNPIKYHLALYISLTMQFIGVVGEALILFGLPLEHSVLRTSLLRFTAFDSTGLILLAAGALIVHFEAHRS